MSRLIHLETATSVCSVATADNGVLVAVETIDDGFKHAENLMVLIEKVLETSGWTYSMLDGIAVSAGPGSYTGLRIGVSTAKGICYALDKPLIAVSTLKTLASGFLRTHTNFEGKLCPMIDARRMEVYTALFDSSLKLLMSDQPMIIEESSFTNWLDAYPVAFFGDGAEKCSPVIGIHPNAVFDLPAKLNAEDMIPEALEAFQKNNFADLAYFEPVYLKPYQGTVPKQS
jgi:tRNA threonylcarbamoyladenosine biosynthesis protein TsaB